MISAQIVSDSLNGSDRLTSFVLQFPRIILSEFNTHRMLSRNSASSRAIPFQKMMDNVLKNPFIPIKWMKDHKGMQGTEFFDKEESFNLERNWLQARIEMVDRAEILSRKGVSKQIVNRLLEPFLWHTVIVTGTEWENFFALRAHPAAEIHMAALAELMLDVYNESTPKKLQPGEWHIPFGDKIDLSRLTLDDFADAGIKSVIPEEGDYEKIKIQIATARCARISYSNFEGKDDYSADIKLHNNLLSMGHLSPFEHCGKAMTEKERWERYGAVAENEIGNGWCGNFKGFIQYRKTFEGENKKDSRIIKK